MDGLNRRDDFNNKSKEGEDDKDEVTYDGD